MKSLTPLVAAAAMVLSLPGGPASAQQLRLDDPAGDAAGKGLDITSTTVRNDDHRIVARVHFVESVRGDLIVSLDPRGGRGIRLVSEYRPVAHTRNLVLRGAFTDQIDDEPPHVVACRGLRVRWSAERPMVTLKVPSTCLHGGDYGALRFAVLTERGADTDIAPDEAASSGWIPRG